MEGKQEVGVSENAVLSGGELQRCEISQRLEIGHALKGWEDMLLQPNFR